jgi:hypothetical protein
VWFFRRDPHVKPEGPLAFRVRVRTRSGEVVEIRLSKSMEISPTETGYSFVCYLTPTPAV